VLRGTVGLVRTPDELTATFRASGLKVTPQRQLLFRLLHGNRVHPTAEALYTIASAAMPGISLRTVYQTLSDLAAMGELTVLDIGSGASRFDPNTDQHHHAVCAVCGEIRDVYIDCADTLAEPGVVTGLDGFVIDEPAIVLRGRCRACSATEH
jgi:Fe2+ or Zn2+ uptake regulation protein